LHGDLNEATYMEIPNGMETNNGILNKTIYSLFQSTREFYNKLMSALKLSREFG
jgi:hypothetical protein